MWKKSDAFPNVTGIFFWLLQFGYSCSKPLGWKGWFTKDRLQCADFDYSNVWEFVRNFLYFFRSRKEQQWPKVSGYLLWSRTLDIEWIIYGVSPVWPSSIWSLGHTVISLTLSLIDVLVILALWHFILWAEHVFVV